MKPRINALALAAITLTVSASPVRATTGWWNNNTSGDWDSTTNWWTTAGGTTTVGTMPGLADSATFNGTGVTGAETVYLNGAQSIGTLNFNNSGTTTLLGGISGTPAVNALTLGAGGINVSNGTGTVTIGDPTGSAAVNLAVTASQTFANSNANGTSLLVINNGITSAAATATQTINLAGPSAAGQGNIAFNGVIGNGGSGGTIAFAISANGQGIYSFNNTNTFTGGITMGTGNATLVAGATNAFGTGMLTVGAGGTGCFMQATGGTQTIANNIQDTSTGGIFTINGSNSLNVSGYYDFNGASLTSSITGGGTLTLGSAKLAHTDASAKTGTLAGAGNTTITGAVANNAAGTNTNSSAFTISNTATTTLNGNNTYTGLTTFSSAGGTLVLAGSNIGAGGLTFTGNNGTVKATHANGLGTGGINYSVSTTGHSLILASGATTTAANNLSWNQNGGFTSTITLDAPISQGGYIQTFGTAAFGQQGNLILNQTSNLTSTGTVAFGASTFGSNNSSKLTQFSPVGVNMTIASLAAVATSPTQTATLVLDGTSQGNTIGVIADGGTGATLNKAAITKQNTSTWTFTGLNTYTGATTINGGSLEQKNLGTDLTQTRSGALTLAGGDVSFQSNNAGTGTLSTTFGSYTARGAGTTANIVSTGGTLGTTNIIKFTSTTGLTASALIDKGLFFNGADYAVYDATGYLRAFNYASDTGFLDVNLAADQTTLGTITSTSNVQLRGTGNITALTGTLNTLKISGSHTLTLTGQLQELGLLLTGGSSTIAGGNLKAGATSGEIVIRVDGSSDLLTINSQILANTNSTITKSGAGTLILGGANTSSSTGTLTINGGVVQLNNSGALNSTAGSQMPVTFAAASTGALALNGYSVTITNLNSNVAVPGTATVENANGTSVADATLTVGNSTNATGTFAGTLKDGTGGGTLSLTKAGTGTFTLSGANSYTGITTVNAGILLFSKKVALYNNTPASWTATNLVINPGGLASFNVGGSGEFTISDFTTLAALGTGSGGFKSGSAIGMDTTNAGGAVTYNTVIANPNSGANALGFAKYGVNTLTLGGANSYTGGTTVGTTATSGGLLVVNNAAALGGAGAGQVNVVNGTINFAVSTASATGIPTVNLTTTTGFLTLNNGVTVNNPIILGGGKVNQITGPATGSATLGGAITWSSGNEVRIDNGGGTLNLNGQITGTDAAQSIMFSRNGAGTIVLGAAANYTGGAAWSGTFGSNTPIGTVIYGGTVKLNAANALGTNANLTFATAAATIDLNGNALNAGWAYNTTGGTVGRFGVITNTATATTAALCFNVTSDNLNNIQNSNAAAYQVLSAAINDGGAGKVVSLEKKGASTLTLINNSSYSGGTTVTAGTLAAYQGSALGTGNITLNGGTLNLNFNAFASAQSTASNTLTDTQATTVTFGGGNLTLNGRPNNSAGTITGSTYNVGSGNPADGRVLTLTTGTTAGLAVGQAVTGTNIAATNYIAMIIDSAHVLLSGGSSSTTTAQANTLGAVTNTTSQTYASAQLNSAATVSVNNNGGGGATLTFNTLNGTGNLTKAGDGTLVVDGASNTYSGTTTVSAGTLQLAATGSLTFTPTGASASNKITGAGAATLDGTLKLDLSAAAIANANSWTIVDVASPTYSLEGVTSTSPALTFSNSSGVWTAVDGSHTWTFTQSTGALTLAVASTGGFANWIDTNYPSLSDKTPGGDPDQDGIKNLMEYALNSNPGASSTASLPALTSDPTHFIFAYNRRVESASDTTQTFEATADMSFTDKTPVTIPGATPGTYGVVTVGSPTGTSPDQVQTITITIPKNADSKLFGRLKVTQP